MIATLRQLFRSKPARPLPAVPAGQRIYAIGDIHGRLDLFRSLIAAIEQDERARAKADTTIVLLGDLIDRGPESAGVIALARDLAARRPTRILAGNHEEMFLQSFERLETLRHFLRFGGRETLLSYPIELAAYREMTIEETQAAMRDVVPPEDLEFIAEFEDRIVIGDYLFVHAGIRPALALEEQSLQDLRWIREPFLSHGGEHGYCVVHGHTISEAVEIRANRIGIDTGAYQSGRLTAVGLEGTARWLIEAAEEAGSITASLQAIA